MKVYIPHKELGQATTRKQDRHDTFDAVCILSLLFMHIVTVLSILGINI